MGGGEQRKLNSIYFKNLHPTQINLRKQDTAIQTLFLQSFFPSVLFPSTPAAAAVAGAFPRTQDSAWRGSVDGPAVEAARCGGEDV